MKRKVDDDSNSSNNDSPKGASTSFETVGPAIGSVGGGIDGYRAEKRAATSLTLARSPSSPEGQMANGSSASSSSSSSSGDSVNGIRSITRHIIQIYSTPQEFERAQDLTRNRPNSVHSIIIDEVTPSTPSLSLSSSEALTLTGPSAVTDTTQPSPSSPGSEGGEAKTAAMPVDVAISAIPLVDDEPTYRLNASVIDLPVAHVRILIKG
jgi:hypothetical protein